VPHDPRRTKSAGYRGVSHSNLIQPTPRTIRIETRCFQLFFRFSFIRSLSSNSGTESYDQPRTDKPSIHARPQNQTRPPHPTQRESLQHLRPPFAYREEWAQDWDIIKFCSDSCRNQKTSAPSAALEQAILTLLAERTADGNRDKTICPSEAAKLVAGDPRNKTHAARRDWEALMEPARAAARRLVAQNKIVITQHNHIVDRSTAKGPIRLRMR
jgi:hypothetical protein